MFKNRKAILLTILAVIFLFWFFLTKNNYFHWDEWHFLMSFNQPVALFLTKPYGEHYLPLNLLNHYLFFRFFGLNNSPFQISVIIFHIINTFLLYKIIFRETNKFALALLGLILFGISNVYNEDLIWSQGVSSVGSAMLISLAFLTFLNFQKHEKNVWLFVSLISLVLSPLFNAFGVLAPFTFIVISFLRVRNKILKKFSMILYFLIGALNLFILFHFSGNQISNSTQKMSLEIFYKIPMFIIQGVVRGNVIRFFFPGLHLFQGNFQLFKYLFSLFFSLTAAILFFKYLIDWLRNDHYRLARITTLVSYLLLIIIGYFTASLGRISYGLSQASIARYSYQSFFFLIILTLIILKDQLKFKTIIVVSLFFWLINLYSLIHFENDFWIVMVSRDRQFITDVSYLFNHNDTVYDFSAVGIYPTVKLSKLWFLYPSDKKINFIDPNLFYQKNSLISGDLKSQEIYGKLLNDYQKKFD